MSQSRRANVSFLLKPFSSLYTMAVPEAKPRQFSNVPRDSVLCSKEEPSFLRFTFAVIVLCTIVGSLMVCAVNIRNKRMLKSPYNVNLFHLAITDLLVSVVIFLTPGFIFQKIPSPPEGALGGEIFCRVISSHFLTFSTATTSVYITVALAIERWYAVARPLQYRAKFHKKRLIYEVFIIWALSLSVNAFLPFEVKYDPQKELFERCEVIKLPYFDEPVIVILGVCQFLFKFLIPFLVTCNLYFHVLNKTHKSRVMNSRTGTDMRHNISRMAAVSTLVLTLCWLPNQVYYACYAFDLVTLNTPVHYATIAIALMNPCLNPFIFAFHSVQYRAGFRNLFCVGSNEKKLERKIRLVKFRLTQLTHLDAASTVTGPSLPISARASPTRCKNVECVPKL